MKLDEITSETLGRAVAMYLERAYPGGEPSAAVRRRADLPPGRRGADLLGDERFERVPADAEVADARRFNLRLGNETYLHMKLSVDRVADTAEFVLRVDTHDRHFAEMVQGADREQFAALVDHNRRLQHEIERAWTRAGLPTFERYLRARLAGLGGARRKEG